MQSLQGAAHEQKSKPKAGIGERTRQDDVKKTSEGAARSLNRALKYTQQRQLRKRTTTIAEQVYITFVDRCEQNN